MVYREHEPDFERGVVGPRRLCPTRSKWGSGAGAEPSRPRWLSHVAGDSSGHWCLPRERLCPGQFGPPRNVVAGLREPALDRQEIEAAAS